MVLLNAVGRRHDEIVGFIVAAVADLHHVVTVAFGIDGLCTGKVGVTLAAEIKRRTGGEIVVRTLELEYTALE